MMEQTINGKISFGGLYQLKKIAYFSPFNPLKSGVSDYSEDFLKHLKNYFNINVYIDKDYKPTKLNFIRNIKKFVNFRNKEDITLFQISGNPIHSYMYPILKKYSGIITMHDWSMYLLTCGFFMNNKLAVPYEFLYNEGLRKLYLLFDCKNKHTQKFNLIKRLKLNLYMYKNRLETFPLNKRIIKSSKGIIVHSNYLKNKIMEVDNKTPIAVIPQGVNEVKIKHSSEKSRVKLNLKKVGINRNSFVILSFGFIQEHKKINEVIIAFKKFLLKNPNSFYVIIGPRDPHYDINSKIEEFNIKKNVLIIDHFIPIKKVNEFINASDLCFNLRGMSLGCTSSTLHKILAVGKPVVVSNIDTFKEYSKTFVFHVDSGEKEIDNLLKIMKKIKFNKKLKDKMAKNAKVFANKNLLWKQVCKKHVKFLERFIEEV